MDTKPEINQLHVGLIVLRCMIDYANKCARDLVTTAAVSVETHSYAEAEKKQRFAVSRLNQAYAIHFNACNDSKLAYRGPMDSDMFSPDDRAYLLEHTEDTGTDMNKVLKAAVELLMEKRLAGLNTNAARIVACNEAKLKLARDEL